MLILLLTGTALAELFSAQQTQSVSSASTARAYWVAEAGLAHAVHDGTDILVPVSFAGGSYTVSRTGSEYTATGEVNGAIRVLSRTVITGPGTTPTGPLDELASAAGADDRWRRVTLPLVSIVPEDIVVESLRLSADAATGPLHRIRLDGKSLYHQHFGTLPLGPLSLTGIKTSDRTIDGFDRPVLELEFLLNPRGFITFALALTFTNGQSSQITFGVDFG